MNKYVYVSGGGSGIGFEIAKLSLKEGFTPVILGRDEKKLKTFKNLKTHTKTIKTLKNHQAFKKTINTNKKP